MILKFSNLKQAHTNLIHNIFGKKIYCQIRNIWENFPVKIIVKSKNCKSPWLKLLELFACTLMLTATFIMIF